MSSIFGNDGSEGITVDEYYTLETPQNAVISTLQSNSNTAVLARVIDLENQQITQDSYALTTRNLTNQNGIDIDNLEIDINTIETNVNNLANLTATNSSNIQTNTTNINNLQISDATQTTNINNLANLIASNSSDIENIEAEQLIQNTNINNLNTNLNLKVNTSTYNANKTTTDASILSIQNYNITQDNLITNNTNAINNFNTNLNLKLDSSVYNVNKITTDNAILNLNGNLNLLQNSDLSQNSRLTILEGRTYPQTASQTPYTTVAGVSGNLTVQDAIQNLQNNINGISTSGSGFNTSITNFINGMNTSHLAQSLIYNRVTNYPKFWSDLSYIDQPLSFNAIPQFQGIIIRPIQDTAYPNGIFNVRTTLAGNQFITRIDTDTSITGQFRIGTNQNTVPITLYKISGSEFRMYDNNATIGINNGISYNLANLINEHSQLWNGKPNQALNTTSDVIFNKIDVRPNVNENFPFNVFNSSSFVKCRITNDGNIEQFNNNVNTFLYSSINGMVANANLPEQRYITAFNNNGVKQFISTSGRYVINNDDAVFKAMELNATALEFYDVNGVPSTYIDKTTIKLKSGNTDTIILNNNGDINARSVYLADTLSAQSVGAPIVTCNDLIANSRLRFPTNNIVINNATNSSLGGISDNNILIGNHATSNSTQQIMIGRLNTSTNNASAIMIGVNNLIGGNTGTKKQILIGDNNEATAESKTFIGHNNHLRNFDGSSVPVSYAFGSNWNAFSQYTTLNGLANFNLLCLGDGDIASPKLTMVIGGGLQSASGSTLPVRITTTRSNNLAIHTLVTDTSSIRYKENVKDSEYDLNKFEKIKLRTYNRTGSDEIENGMIAEELVQIYPEFVVKNNANECEGIDYSRMICLLIAKIQELEITINTLK